MGRQLQGVCKCYSREDTLQTQQRISTVFWKQKVVKLVVRTSVAAVVGLLTVGTTLGVQDMGVEPVQAQAHRVVCAKGERVYTVKRGETLGTISKHLHVNWHLLAKRNHISNPNFLSVQQRLCVPRSEKSQVRSAHKHVVSKKKHNASRSKKASHHKTHASSQRRIPAQASSTNTFPYGACTWWANHRYHQLHGIYVPWHINANAWQWSARAREFGWQVSTRPRVGAIVDMQPWIQGAYGLGHVGIVEQVNRDGTAVISSMSWGARPWSVSYASVRPGSGITFITT